MSPSFVYRQGPADLLRMAEGVRWRWAKAFDLVAWLAKTMINARSGVWLKKGKRIKFKDLVGREPMGAIPETKADREARKRSLLAFAKKVRQGEKDGRKRR